MTSPVFLVDEQIRSLLDQSITRHYLSTLTDQQGKICAEYVWIGGTGADLRSKARTLNFVPKKPEVRRCAVLHFARDD
jgi:glutamine synthetase